jgi:peptidylprolyl isomerase
MRALVLLLLVVGCASTHTAPGAARTADEVLAQAPASDWRVIPPEEMLVAETAKGRIVIFLAPHMAPATIANVLALAHAGWYDGLGFIRSQDDYVAQWGDGDNVKPVPGPTSIPAELDRSRRGMAWVDLPDVDTYADDVGFSGAFPAARDATRGWLTHCYGMVGVGRDEAADSGVGNELYFVTGHAPRHLDRNVTLIGRVIEGMPIITTLPRGTEKMGFYATAAERLPIITVRLASELPEASRPRYRTLDTRSASFAALVEARRNRRDPWTKRPAGHIDVCNVPNATQVMP